MMTQANVERTITKLLNSSGHEVTRDQLRALVEAELGDKVTTPMMRKALLVLVHGKVIKVTLDTTHNENRYSKRDLPTATECEGGCVMSPTAFVCDYCGRSL